jgi:predicted nucleic acid-binding protein
MGSPQDQLHSAAAFRALWRPNLPDEADNHLIELALAGNADTIVTTNTKDLAHGELRFPGLKILSPAKAGLAVLDKLDEHYQ